jgi:RimJ/RimL family protein N-acetyltransferase
MAVRRPRAQQNARRHIDGWQSQPVIVIDGDGVYTHGSLSSKPVEMNPAEETFMITPNLLRGEKVRLTAVQSSDMAAITRWWHDPDFMRLYNTQPAAPRNEDQLSRRFDLSQTSSDAYLFAIRLLDDDDLIGLLELDGVEWVHRTTFLSIGIGAAEHRGQGYGRDAMIVALRFAFHELNLHRVCLTVFSYNLPAIALYEQLGFQREGVYREHLERDGQRYDMYLYGLLRREWKSGQ